MTEASRPALIRASLALAALFLGVAVYLLDRQPERVYFLAQWVISSDETNPFFGVFGNHLPTSLHVFAFILLTAVIVAPSRGVAAAICVVWLVIDSILELAQMDAIAGAIVNHLPTWFEAVPLLNNTSAYFLGGTFDVIDLASIALGAVAAYLTFVITSKSARRPD